MEHVESDLMAGEVVDKFTTHLRNTGTAYKVITGAKDYQKLPIEIKKECSLLGVKDHCLVHYIMRRSTSMKNIISIYPFSNLIRDEHLSFDRAETRHAPGVLSAPFYENSVASGLGEHIMHSTTEA